MSDEQKTKEHAEEEHSKGSKVRSNLYFGIEINLLAVHDVDQTFSCIITLQMYWRKKKDLLTAAPRSFRRESIDIDKLPKIDIHLTSSKELINCEYWESDKGDCYASLDYDLVIREPLELHRFPYDRQLLKVHMSCQDYVFHGLCKLDDELHAIGISRRDLFPPGFLQSSLKKCDSSVLYDHDNWEIVKYHIQVKDLTSRHVSICFATIRVQRCLQFYVYSFIFVLYWLVGSGATVHFTEWTDFSTRSSLLLTLMIAAISYRFSTTAFLPLVNHLTLLDYYIFFGFLFIACIVLETFVLWANRDGDPLLLNQFDRLFFQCYVICWTAINIFIGLTFYIPAVADSCVRMPWWQVKANDEKSPYSESGKFDTKRDDYGEPPKSIVLPVLPTLGLRSRQSRNYQSIN